TASDHFSGPWSMPSSSSAEGDPANDEATGIPCCVHVQKRSGTESVWLGGAVEASGRKSFAAWPYRTPASASRFQTGRGGSHWSPGAWAAGVAIQQAPAATSAAPARTTTPSFDQATREPEVDVRTAVPRPCASPSASRSFPPTTPWLGKSPKLAALSPSADALCSSSS